MIEKIDMSILDRECLTTQTWLLGEKLNEVIEKLNKEDKNGHS